MGMGTKIKIKLKSINPPKKTLKAPNFSTESGTYGCSTLIPKNKIKPQITQVKLTKPNPKNAINK
jgi:hypothetical protein